MRIAHWVAAVALSCSVAGAGEVVKKSHAPGSMFGRFSWQQKERPWYMHVVWYLPSRAADLLDVVGIEVAGGGFGAHGNVRLTRYMQLGMGREWSTHAGLMSRYLLVADNEIDERAAGWFWEFDLRRETLLGTAQSVDIGEADVQKGYYKEMDPTAIGVSVFGGVLGASAEVKPHEIVDFVLGIFTIDSLGDDY